MKLLPIGGLIGFWLCLHGCSEGELSNGVEEPGDTSSLEVDTATGSGEVHAVEPSDTVDTSHVPDLNFSDECYEYSAFIYGRDRYNSVHVSTPGDALGVNNGNLACGQLIPQMLSPFRDPSGWAYEYFPFNQLHSFQVSESLPFQHYALDGPFPSNWVYEDGAPTLYDLQCVGVNDRETMLFEGRLEGSHQRYLGYWKTDLVVRVPFSGEMEALPQDLNNDDSIVGYLHQVEIDTDLFVAVEYSDGFVLPGDGGAPIYLDPLPGAPARARLEPRGINDHGVVCGRGLDALELWKPFTWDGVNYRVLPTLGGNEGDAYAINNDGKVVGESLDEHGVWWPVLWDNAEIQKLGLLETVPMEKGTARGINSDGAVVGWDTPLDPSLRARGWVWKDGSKTDLTEMLAPQAQLHVSKANQISDEGVIVGSVRSSSAGWYDSGEYGVDVSSSQQGPFPVGLVPNTCAHTGGEE